MTNSKFIILILFTTLVSCGEGKINSTLDTTAIVEKSNAGEVSQKDLDELSKKLQKDIDEDLEVNDGSNAVFNRVVHDENQTSVSEDDSSNTSSNTSSNSDQEIGESNEDDNGNYGDIVLTPDPEVIYDLSPTVSIGETDLDFEVGQVFQYRFSQCRLIQISGFFRVICLPTADGPRDDDRELSLVESPCYDLGTIYEHGDEWDGLVSKPVKTEVVSGFSSQRIIIESEQIVYERKRCEDGTIIFVED